MFIVQCNVMSIRMSLRRLIFSDQNVKSVFVVARRVAFDAFLERFAEESLEGGFNFCHIDFTAGDDQANQLAVVGAYKINSLDDAVAR